MLLPVLEAGFHDQPDRVHGVRSRHKETLTRGQVAELNQGLAQLVQEEFAKSERCAPNTRALAKKPAHDRSRAAGHPSALPCSSIFA